MADAKQKLLTAKQVREFFGGISDMGLWRWLNDPELGFPKPIYIKRMRYWQQSEIDAFAQRQQTKVT